MTLRYFDGCPHWRTAHELLRAAMDEAGIPDAELMLERVETAEDAERLEFIGSPTILIDGRDPFADGQQTYGLSCRVYQTPEGMRGVPTPQQLGAALRGA